MEHLPDEPTLLKQHLLLDAIKSPIDTSWRERAVEAVSLTALAYTIDRTSLDALSGGYAADAVGTTAGIACMSLMFRKGDPRLLPVGLVLTANALIEQAQENHLLANVLPKLDGVYDVRDFAAVAAGGLLYLGIDKIKRIIRSRRMQRPEGELPSA